MELWSCNNQPKKAGKNYSKVEDILTYYRLLVIRQNVDRYYTREAPCELYESLLTLGCFKMTVTPVSQTSLRMNPCYRENIQIVLHAPYSFSFKSMRETFIDDYQNWQNE